MPQINLSHTTPINPPSATPPLTAPQLWAGLQRKIRFAQEFVPVIESCTVLSEEPASSSSAFGSSGTVVTREVIFKKGLAPKPQAKEVVTSYWPSWVEFEQEDGSVIRNIISEGGEGELYMTYAFQFDVQGEEGSKALEEEVGRLKKMAKTAVESSITAIRDMVKDGRITV
ncbi:DUF1857 domain containing protein [Pyrenophora tritici-repentis]|uniref:DUF1857 domain containing protein n=2 Tax=Pyrenophora tritici-repentis TaxID=45151 RepID=A0A922SXP9_9PLEO|nr:uncharacterized protein PTRG_04221 [Pyrenophora tritici-repentis Pt-1C-BFP]EDU47059.1 conserved hypothetical protein [Pyrenophora tritici-repentis Pt-1C-BFP]KAI1510538.1 DUF1857 domain containing protein [Pyrenophora tritici-repentis]KAI1669925.1 DUF1857 domain containing protein [Pyrenophora tritici-repentis]KAI1681518.1 DUF1857 domain containing protein [Pyrenophora tritici-repentis]